MTVSTFVEFAWKGPVVSILHGLTHSILSTTLCGNIMNLDFTDEKLRHTPEKVTGTRAHSLALESVLFITKLCCHKLYSVCLFAVTHAL